ncbi:hypothetical protein TI05_12695 [Achromatium sp. WMS3]|nr:hypothetical protein TI04_13855 [Achromatium sp. WMS2]KOR29442.1 hypothetical protein TI03_02315 [Achromatium sp. WMS1]KOR31549.1 hypothetical protein TI05_12695 [Achromatium sp. WMS3]
MVANDTGQTAPMLDINIQQHSTQTKDDMTDDRKETEIKTHHMVIKLTKNKYDKNYSHTKAMEALFVEMMDNQDMDITWYDKNESQCLISSSEFPWKEQEFNKWFYNEINYHDG